MVKISKIVFILPTSSQPRYHKRVEQAVHLGEVIVFAFNRGLYEENAPFANIKYIFLGKIKDREYFKRFFRIIAAIVKIRRHLKNYRDCLFYAMSFDCLIIAKLCGLKNGYYEVGDLRQVDGGGKFFAFLEKYLLKNILGLVLTSSSFYEEYYGKNNIVPKRIAYFIANKVPSALKDKRPPAKEASRGRISIGLIGLLRYRRPIELLLQFVRERPSLYIIECFGDGPLRGLIESYICENIHYYGSFKNPEKLPEIYASIDLNYVVYDNSSRNVQLAIPNKLYESAFFGVPIICCDKTAVGEIATNWQIGKMVRIDNMQHYSEDIEAIDSSWLQACSKKALNIPAAELIDDGEKVLREMIGKERWMK